MMTMPERFRIWFDYERDCNRKTLEMLESVPSDRHSSPEYARALGRMGHIVSARRRWLARLMQTGVVFPLFPQVTDIESLAVEIEKMERKWVEYLNALDDVELERAAEWTTDEGVRHRWNVEGILTHVSGHTYYHRGQVAQLVAGLGGKAVDTYYLFWAKVETID